MDRAIALLSGSTMSVSEVAEHIGFSTPAHFVAAFRGAMRGDARSSSRRNGRMMIILVAITRRAAVRESSLL